MTDSTKKIKELLLLDIEKVYSILEKKGYRKFSPEILSHAEYLLQKKHYTSDGRKIFFNIHSYPPIHNQTEYSFEVSMGFDTAQDYWASIKFYSFSPERIVKEIDDCEIKLVKTFRQLNGLGNN